MTILGPIAQVAYFVTDVRAAAAQMAELHGAGPFFVVDRIELAWGELRGERCDFLHSSAYGQWGEIMVEFVQQDVEGPSPFREMYHPGAEGIHHVAVIVDDLQAAYRALSAAGIELVSRAETRSGTEFAFVDTVAKLGHMTEIYEGSPGLVGFYDFVRAASLDWDGSDPVRTLTRPS